MNPMYEGILNNGYGIIRDGKPGLGYSKKSDIMTRKLLYITKYFIFALMILTFGVGCGDDKEKQGIQPPADVEQELSKFSLVQTRAGQTRWKLNAEMATFLDSDRVSLKKTDLLIFGDNENETLTVHGQQGEVDQRTNDIKITGDVKGNFSSGGQFFAQEVFWSESRGKVYTKPGVKVKIVYEDTVINGEELEADPKLETASLKNVEGTARAEEKADEE